LKEKIMRAFFLCAALTVAALTISTDSLQAGEWHRGYYYYGPRPVVVVRPAPIVVAPAPVAIAPAPVVVTPGYGPAVIVRPAFHPLISLRIGR
jgi:hypothetical protein